MNPRKFIIPLLVAAALLLSSCGAIAGAKQIASSPRQAPIAVYPGQLNIVYSGYMELQVADVDGATTQAARLADSYGGYFTGSQAWYVDGRKVASVSLAVPTANFDGLCQAVRGLGVLINETIDSRPSDPPAQYNSPYSSLTVQLHPGDSSPIYIPEPVPPSSDWDPLRTLRHAFAVFVSIFGFLADIVIWVVVVAGPFLVLGGIAVLVIRRMRRKAS